MDATMLVGLCILLVLFGGAAWYVLLRPKKYTVADVEAHNNRLTTAYGYWVVYEGAIYDMTPFAKLAEAEAKLENKTKDVLFAVLMMAMMLSTLEKFGGWVSDADKEKIIVKSKVKDYMTKVADLDPSGGTTMHVSYKGTRIESMDDIFNIVS